MSRDEKGAEVGEKMATCRGGIAGEREGV